MITDLRSSWLSNNVIRFVSTTLRKVIITELNYRKIIVVSCKTKNIFHYLCCNTCLVFFFSFNVNCFYLSQFLIGWGKKSTTLWGICQWLVQKAWSIFITNLELACMSISLSTRKAVLLKLAKFVPFARRSGNYGR